KKMSMIELANLVLGEKKETVPFKALFDEIAVLKDFTDEQKGTYIAQFYTDINVDGRFVNKGSNIWGLKRWYPVEQIIKEKKTVTKKKTKKRPIEKKPDIKEDDENEQTRENNLEELTADFSDLDGKDDVDEEIEDLDIFAEELESDAEYDDEDDEDEYDEDDEE